MNFDLSDEQRMLHESVQRLMAEQYAFDTRARSSCPSLPKNVVRRPSRAALNVALAADPPVA